VIEPAAQLRAAGLHYPTDLSNLFFKRAARSALARFLRREARNLFLSLQTATERHES
jgi:hypothetical protein